MIVACAGGKGGVGTSTVAAALADRLEAVLVETDLAMGRAPAVGPTVEAVLAGRVAPVEAVRAGPDRHLPAGRSLRGARAADLRRLAPILEELADAFGAVVVDCPSGLSAAVGAPLLAADGCVLVTAPDEAALVGALRVAALARRLDAGLVRVALVGVEKAAPAVGRALGAPVVAVPTGDTAPPSSGITALAEAVQSDCSSS